MYFIKVSYYRTVYLDWGYKKAQINPTFITEFTLLTLISLINMEVGINMEGGILWKKLMYNSNKRGVEGGKNLSNQ